MPRLTLSSFRRIIRSGTFIPEIDGLRFIAITAVVLLHCYAAFVHQVSTDPTPFACSGQPCSARPRYSSGVLRLIEHGGYGVELFFSISGFILALPFARQYLLNCPKVKIRSYFLRRITRLEPPYIIALLIRSALLLASGAQGMKFVTIHLLASIFYIHNVLFGIASRIEAVSWTLEIEAQFYCLAPLLALIFRMSSRWLRRSLLLIAILGATPLQRAFLPGWHGPQNAGAFNLSILAAIQFFLVGLFVADLYVDGWDQIPYTPMWDVVSAPLWYLMFWLPPHGFRFFGPLILPVVFVGAFKGRLIPRILRNPVITTVGGMCYSIYLTHRTTVSALQIVLAHLHLRFSTWMILSLTLGGLSSFVVAAIYFRLVERPCMDPEWPQKLRMRFRFASDSSIPGQTMRSESVGAYHDSLERKRSHPMQEI